MTIGLEVGPAARPAASERRRDSPRGRGDESGGALLGGSARSQGVGELVVEPRDLLPAQGFLFLLKPRNLAPLQDLELPLTLEGSAFLHAQAFQLFLEHRDDLRPLAQALQLSLELRNDLRPIPQTPQLSLEHRNLALPFPQLLVKLGNLPLPQRLQLSYS